MNEIAERLAEIDLVVIFFGLSVASESSEIGGKLISHKLKKFKARIKEFSGPMHTYCIFSRKEEVVFFLLYFRTVKLLFPFISFDSFVSYACDEIKKNRLKIIEEEVC